MPEHVACIGEEQRKYRTKMAFLRGKCRIFIPLTIELYVSRLTADYADSRRLIIDLLIICENLCNLRFKRSRKERKLAWNRN